MTLFAKVKKNTFTYIKRRGRPQIDGQGTEKQKHGIKIKPSEVKENESKLQIELVTPKGEQ